ncbi:calcium-activated chloride channel regulator 4A-like isoform X2 [Ruditapes philippinarum]|uniref:calcium-activated chloride channel regulator 4A-like isoform X2 n=1 Tax=Ruditapes philippinarum TaxID=129788 RepID=UPI00295B6D24|nr:calcium-activated chloride channel regulator 4A-like isoform X2 [Ruditapes philippinarum]
MREQNMKILVFLIMCWCFKYIAPIRVNNGGYEDMYIVIQDNNEDSEFLLERIQKIFTDASELLFTATKNYLYFKKIKVIVPRTWQHKEKYKKALIPSHIKQEIIIDNTKQNEKGTPRVNGITACGKGDRVIVHEFGHLRYGLYDEYPISGGSSQFYQHEGEWKPTGCTEDIQGEIGIGSHCEKSNACDYKNTGKKMDDNCDFCPDQNQNLEASLMGYQWIDALSKFCERNDTTTSKHVWHNPSGKNLHNKRCSSKSAWEIMSNHQDFSDAHKLPNSTDTQPTFEFIQENEQYRVLVLDVSGSMEGKRLEILQQVTTLVIKDLIPSGSYLGIIAFSNTATVVQQLTNVTSDSVRDQLINSLPTVAEGGTCIGCGIESAIELFKMEQGEATNGEIILVSDGENNEGNIDKSRQKMLTEKVTVHTVSVTQDADLVLADISTESGGKHFTYLETGTSSFIALFDEIIVSSHTSASKQTVVLASERINSTTSSIVKLAFPIEKNQGENTFVAVIVQSDYNGRLYINLTGPNNFSRTLITAEKTATVRIPDIAQPGDYETTITMDTSGISLEYVVKSTPISSDIIRVEAYMSASKIDFKTGELPIIYTEVTKEYSQVINANVTARVESNDGGKGCNEYLYDNGLDPDDIRDDGIYSAYILPQCLGAGRINVKIFAKGQEGKVRIKSVTAGGQAPYQEEQLTEYNERFQRVRLMEDLYIENYEDPGLNDTVPPGRITDVDIHNIVTKATLSGESRSFTIAWTATGDDKSIGRASAYIFRISDDFKTLQDNFDNAELLDVGNFSFKPLNSGEKEALKIIVDAEKSYTSTVFFALKAVDEVGNTGDVSNILSIVVAKGFRAHGEAGSLETEDVDVDKPEGRNVILYIILGSSAGVVVFLTIVITVCLCRNRRAPNAKNTNVPLGRV